VALSGLLAVAAGAVELAESIDGEAVDGDSTCRIMLDDLILGTSGTSTRDGCVAVALERERV
tara:strand:+ start:8084 stop:8269 length:186 start_codon:yes stop_codon:yes gene_type:complete